MPDRPRCLELFAGAGGASLGMTRAGFKVDHAEWDHDACETLRAAFPGDTVVEGDVRQLDWSRWAGEVDLMWSSFPCQCWSSAGKRLGARDADRNGWPWTVDALDAVKPTWLLCENVLGLLRHNGGPGCAADPMDCPGCYFERVILVQLRDRFAWVDYRVVNAADFGVPQRRERVILAAGPRPLGWPRETHTDPSLTLSITAGRRRPWVTVREALGDTIGRPTTIPLAYEMRVAKYDRGPSDRFRRQPHGLASSVMATLGAATVPIVLIDDVAGDGLDIFEEATAGEVRRLSVEECAILQSFPPDYPFRGPRTARHRQVGNAVAPLVAEAFARSVMEMLS